MTEVVLVRGVQRAAASRVDHHGRDAGRGGDGRKDVAGVAMDAPRASMMVLYPVPPRVGLGHRQAERGREGEDRKAA